MTKTNLFAIMINIKYCKFTTKTYGFVIQRGWATQLFHYPVYTKFKIVKNYIINLLKRIKNSFTIYNQIPLYNL